MDKVVLLKKLNRKFTTKTAKFKEYYEKSLETYKFLLAISGTNHPNITENQPPAKITPKLETYKNLYKKYRQSIDNLLDVIDIETLKPCPDEVLRREQLRCVDFCKEITDFFDSNNLEYFITSGTLIGAMRHKGFIPWDDDFDVGMMRKDYEKLKEILRANFQGIDISRICASKHNKTAIVNKILKSSQGKMMYIIGPKYIQIYRGTCLADSTLIDIFSYDFYREDYTLGELKKDMARIKKETIKIDNFKKMYNYLESELKNSPNVVEKSNKVYYGIDNLGSYIVNPTDFFYYDKIFPRKKMEFEGYEFYAPNDPIAYTKVQYPDYKSFPRELDIAPYFKMKLGFKR